MASGLYSSGSASIVGCQNSEDDTLPTRKSSSCPASGWAANHLAFAAGSAQAAKTRAGGAG